MEKDRKTGNETDSFEVHQQELIKEGVKSAAIFGGSGLFGHYLLTKNVPRYAKHTLPFKVFVLCTIPMAAFFTSMDNNHSARYKTPSTVVESGESTAVTYILENQAKVAGLTWLSIMAVSLGYNFSRKNIGFTQKLINSRLVAQSGALLGIVAIAYLSQGKKDVKPKNIDTHFESVISKK